MKRIWAIAASALLCWTGIAQAASLDWKNVPADAKWVAHVNVDAARSSQVVQKFVQQCGKDLPWSQERFHKFAHEFGLDQSHRMHGITAYGTELGSHGKVVILRADWDKKALQEKAEKAPDHKVTDYGQYKIHTFTAHKDTKHAHEVAATLYKPDVLVLASSIKRLKAALDVRDGKDANLAGKQSPLAANASEGTILLFRAVDLKDSKAAKWHPALELIKSFSYEKGEHDGKWFGNLTVTADSNSTAEKVRKVIEGYGAWLSLHSHKSPWFVELLNKAKLSVDGNVVKVRFEEKADTLVAHMPELCKAVQEHIKMMHMRHHWMEKKPSACPSTCPLLKKECPLMKKECPLMKKDTGTSAGKSASKEVKKEIGAASSKESKEAKKKEAGTSTGKESKESKDAKK